MFSSDELEKTNSLKDLKTFHKKFVSFLKTIVFLRNALNTSEELDHCFNNELLDFCRNCWADCSDLNEFKDLIGDVKIENNRNGSNILKFTLQTYVCVYQKLMDFPQGRFDYELLTTINFFVSALRIINVKIHLHHLHVTGKIIGYPHEFCNMKVRENQNQFYSLALHIIFSDLICFF